MSMEWFARGEGNIVKPRLVICLFVSTLLGVGAAAYSVIGGLGVLVALLAYSGTASVALFGLALLTMPREHKADADHPALLPAPGHSTTA